MTIFTHILFPTDGSDNSYKAQGYLLKLADKYQAKVTILNTFKVPVFIDGYEMYPDIYKKISDEMKDKSQKLLDKTKGEIQDFSPLIETVSETGKTGKIIVETASNRECDLIIMGSRGHGSVKSFLIGSVSNYVIHHAKCPVLIIH